MSQEDPDTYCLECGTYMSFEEMMWDLASCKACLVNSNYCIGCTAEARCPICEVCVAKESTPVNILDRNMQSGFLRKRLILLINVNMRCPVCVNPAYSPRVLN